MAERGRIRTSGWLPITADESTGALADGDLSVSNLTANSWDRETEL